MKANVRYVVTRGSDDGTFEIGDQIKLLDDGCILLCNGLGGWIGADDVPTAIIGIECDIDRDWLEKKRQALERELAEFV